MRSATEVPHLAPPLRDIGIIDRPEPAAALLQRPVRLRILERLREPDSATGVARTLGLPRQRINYHVRELEKEGLLREVGERKRGNCVERLVQATARRYLIAPQTLGELGADAGEVEDRFSTAYLLGAAARTIRDVGLLREAADRAGKRLPTLTAETEIRFRSPADQQAFAEEATIFLQEMAARFHDAEAPDGRAFRLTFTGHPTPRGPGAPGAVSPPDGEPASEDTRTGDGP